MSSKLRIKIGEVEIDYEGSEDFLKEELPQLLATAMELHKASETTQSQNHVDEQSSDTMRGGESGIGLTTGGMAAKLRANSAVALLRCAAGHLTLVKNKIRFSRQDLLSEMKSAAGYYKKTYSNNLTKSINTCLKDGTISEVGTNTYTLSAKAKSELEKNLVDD